MTDAQINAATLAQLQAECRRLRDENEVLKTAGATGYRALAVAAGSKSVALDTVLEDVHRLHQPFNGQQLPGETQATLREMMGVSQRRYAMARNQWVQNPANQRYQGPPGHRLRAVRPVRALGGKMRMHTVVMPQGLAHRIKKKVVACEQDVLAIGRSHNANFSVHEARKYIAGRVVEVQSANQQVAGSLFTGLNNVVRTDRHDP